MALDTVSFMLSVNSSECRLYALCMLIAECYYAECRSAKCRGAGDSHYDQAVSHKPNVCSLEQSLKSNWGSQLCCCTLRYTQ
jgi:hypothetical protein